MSKESAVDRGKGSGWLLVVEVASFALLGYYVYLVLYPDGTERGMRSWSWASKACYGGAAALGQAGMKCEQRYMSMTGG
jgi:hypothetical protein